MVAHPPDTHASARTLLRCRPVSDWDTDTNVTHESEQPSPRATRRDRACLLVLSGARVGAVFHLDRSELMIGRSQRAELSFEDDGVSRTHARIRREGSDYVVEDLGSRNGTFVNGGRVRTPTRVVDGDKIQLGRSTILKFTFHDALDDSYQERMIESALRDPLTRLYNKRYFDERIDAELRFARRHGTQLSLLMIDVDHFKKVNDERGHLAGDTVLREVSAALQKAVRNEDVVARYGGEELVVLSRAISLEAAIHLAGRLRHTIEELSVAVEGGPAISVTVSVGVASTHPTDEITAEQLIAAADRALYVAKDRGRNQVAN